MLVYSSGLRVSEVVALKREHIDLARRVIHIRLGKGRKDRFTILSEKAADFITQYCAVYNIQDWIFQDSSQTVIYPFVQPNIYSTMPFYGLKFQKNLHTQPSPYFRHSPFGKRYRYTLYSGFARPFKPPHNRTLHPHRPPECS